MNYGKYFRLNQTISRIEEGVVIFDYIDLPAYFESSSKVPMSPKYPISVVFTENSVLFRVHYSAYKTEEKSIYGYSVEEIKNKNNGSTKGMKMAHMEEVILSLPYANDLDDNLYHTIKEVYDTPYPLLINKQTTFIYELISKRYVENTPNPSVENKLYEKLRESIDGDFSYSTLKLMDILSNGDSVKKTINLYGFDGQEKVVVKFLRKLLLDFMFDLKHSDVFQTSKYYQAMFSGLMSNFYFSALMHKCEYYFYREMVTDIIENKRITDEDNEDDKIKKHIKGLYSQELIEAESLWVHDIMNPLADNFFSHKSGLENGILKKVKDCFKELEYRPWDSWFASPEEEMRRVCFTTKETASSQNSTLKEEQTEKQTKEYPEKITKHHICNAETIAMYLEDSDKYKLDEKLVYKKNNEKVAISQWFLKRFAFNDVLHLHLFRHAIIPTFTTISLFIICLFIFPNFLSNSFWNVEALWKGEFSLPIIRSILPIICSITYCILLICWCIRKYREYKKFSRIINNEEKDSVLFDTKRKLVRKRILAIILTLIPAIITIYIFNLIPTNSISTGGVFLRLILEIVQILIIVGCGYFCYKMIYPVHWLSNMHVFLPRLTASIAAAWLTLAIGNELFGTFFDSLVSWSTSILLTIIVFTFLMFEMNKKLPLEETSLKVIRCLQVIIISYVISLITGIFIINFTGERFLERSGVLNDFYKDYVYHRNSKRVENHEYYLSPDENHLIKDSVDKELLNELKNIHLTQDNPPKAEDMNHPITIVWDSGFFILRDFLIQFAFVAMFIGIFIQMLFEERSITEV